MRPARPALPARRCDGIRDTRLEADLARPEKVRTYEAPPGQRLWQLSKPEIGIEKEARPFFQNVGLPFKWLKHGRRAV